MRDARCKMACLLPFFGKPRGPSQVIIEKRFASIGYAAPIDEATKRQHGASDDFSGRDESIGFCAKQVLNPERPDRSERRWFR
jgi:hypothetical protein